MIASIKVQVSGVRKNCLKLAKTGSMCLKMCIKVASDPSDFFCSPSEVLHLEC